MKTLAALGIAATLLFSIGATYAQETIAQPAAGTCLQKPDIKALEDDLDAASRDMTKLAAELADAKQSKALVEIRDRVDGAALRLRTMQEKLDGAPATGTMASFSEGDKPKP